MSSILGDPCPHAQIYTSFGSPITLPVPATGGIILSNFGGGAVSVTFTTVGGETLTFTATASAATSSGPIFVPIQVKAINAATNVGAVTALWH